jgi:beta-galactosidase/beta-glucuronidase
MVLIIGMKQLYPTIIGLLLINIFYISGIHGQEWKMADVPLATPWAEHIDPESVHQEYPRPVMQRDEWKNLNGLWQFEMAHLGDKLPHGVDLSDQILVPFPWESALSGIRKQFDSNRAWYRRTFRIPEKWSGKQIILHFGAVDWEAKVFVNGKHAGTHMGGYDSFYFDITAYLDENKTDQELIVKVYDPSNTKPIATGKQNRTKFDNPAGYSYTPSSGIWQTVWIEPVSSSHINDYQVVSDIDKELITLTINTVNHQSNHLVKVVVKDNGNVINSATGQPNQQFTLSIPDPKLWSPDSPFLYDMDIFLRDEDNEIIDQVHAYFGMRKISLVKEAGIQMIQLNNETIFQMGPLDQGYWPDGIYTAPSDEALQWDVEMIKEWGFNMIRKHIKIEPQRWYYHCDRIGLLVWQDMPGTFGQRNEDEKIQFESELQRMIKGYWNHPSIVNWIVFNEHWGIYDVERLTRFVMELDPTRLVTGNSGIDAGRPRIDYEVGHIKSNHSYRPPNVALVSAQRATVCGEYGAIGYLAEGHVWDEDGPWVHYNYEGLEAATDEYERFIEMILDFRSRGLAGAVYTQWTDVENEMNGLYTYDRKLIKLDKDRVTRANMSTWQTVIPIEIKGQ